MCPVDVASYLFFFKNLLLIGSNKSDLNELEEFNGKVMRGAD